MKYALITIHATQNYGSLLQTYSTYEAIKSLNKDITLLNYHNKAIAEREIPFTERPVKSPADLVKKIMWGPDQKKKYDGVFEFLNKNTVLSKKYDKTNIKEANDEFDAFVVGSDIVWGTKITGCDMTYFLDFADETKKKMAFSSSVGTKWDESEQEQIKPLIEKFDSISVREQLASDWICELSGESVPVTCDPTMLWKTDFWSSFIEKDYIPKEKYILIYAVNPDKRNITDGVAYAKKHGLKAYFVNFYAHLKGTKTVRPTSVNQWITLFANAEAVFSASYHGLLFSLYFHRPVFFYNRGEKSRMISLSQELRIEHREGSDENICLNKPIDFDYVDKVLAEKRKFSWQYLKDCLQ